MPVRLTIHDVSGRRVRTLLETDVGPGDYRCMWDGRDEGGRRVSPGVFFCVLKSGREHSSAKIAVLE
jgi:hypothetical protein